MKNLGFTFVGGKKLRNGITTGTCVSVATKAALVCLSTGEPQKEVMITLPIGKKIWVPVHHTKTEVDEVTCLVRKDAGDDPDITDGILLGATVKKVDKSGYLIKGGVGVGRVTKSGLPAPVGEPAINPVPMQMISSICEEFIGELKGFEVTIFVPEGEQIGKRTLNPKLGILGGISILGTTGIVKPMSEEAFKESLRVELEMYVSRGHKKIVLVPGNYGDDFCKVLYGKDIKWPIIKVSNFFGYMLDQCERLGVEEILLIGDLGKMIKLSGGIFHTHSRVADCRMELMTAYGALCGADISLLEKIMEAPTTVGVIEILEDAKDFPLQRFYDMITQRVNQRVTCYCHDQVKVTTILFSREKGELARVKDLPSVLT